MLTVFIPITVQMSIGLSIYYPYVMTWLAWFPRKQMMFVKAEELYANTTSVLHKVFDFLHLGTWIISKLMFFSGFRFSF